MPDSTATNAASYTTRWDTITGDNVLRSFTNFPIGETKFGRVGLVTHSARCLNPKCNQLILTAQLKGAVQNHNGYWISSSGEPIESWFMRPNSSAKPQPEYIPKPLRQDYEEACLVRDLSPKASATLARRCLQGMIRNFCGISKSRLVDEIKELRDSVQAGTAPAVWRRRRSKQSIMFEASATSAHMERDIDQIVDVDPGEAQALIELIEMLFEEWYVARHTRQERLSKVQSIVGAKAEIIAEYKAPANSPSPGLKDVE
jgi:hypothetical protein